jgi:hypothetical protein
LQERHGSSIGWDAIIKGPRKRMNRSEVVRRKQRVEKRYGPWTAHNIQLCDDLYTIDASVVGGSEVRLQQVVQIVADVAHGPIEELRVLDLGALEGLFALEFARRGASVLAIEGREANIEKIRFAKEVLELDRLELSFGRCSRASAGAARGVRCRIVPGSPLPLGRTGRVRPYGANGAGLPRCNGDRDPRPSLPDGSALVSGPELLGGRRDRTFHGDSSVVPHIALVVDWQSQELRIDPGFAVQRARRRRVLLGRRVPRPAFPHRGAARNLRRLRAITTVDPCLTRGEPPCSRSAW